MIINIRTKAIEAFKLARKEGIVCRVNFSCCGSCAGYELFTYIKDKKGLIGAAFWHQQDEQGYRDAPDGKGSLFIGYGAKESGDVTDEQIGQKLIAAFQKVGLHPVWNGNSNTRIQLSEEAEAVAQDAEASRRLDQQLSVEQLSE